MKMIWKFVPQETKFLVLYLPYTCYFCVIVGHKWHTEYLTCSRLTITYSRSVLGLPFTWITVQCTKQTLAKSFLSSELGGNFGGTILLLIIKGCPDRLILRFTVKLYILLKNLFHWIFSNFYKDKHGHDFFWLQRSWRLLEAKNTLLRPKMAWRSQFIDKCV